MKNIRVDIIILVVNMIIYREKKNYDMLKGCVLIGKGHDFSIQI